MKYLIMYWLHIILIKVVEDSFKIVCLHVRKIIHSLKLVGYTFLRDQADKPLHITFLLPHHLRDLQIPAGILTFVVEYFLGHYRF